MLWTALQKSEVFGAWYDHGPRGDPRNLLAHGRWGKGVDLVQLRLRFDYSDGAWRIARRPYRLTAIAPIDECDDDHPGNDKRIEGLRLGVHAQHHGGMLAMQDQEADEVGSWRAA